MRQRHNLPLTQAVGMVWTGSTTRKASERLRAVERLFELQPDWIGRFTFIQIAAPTRAASRIIRPTSNAFDHSSRGSNARFSTAFSLPFSCSCSIMNRTKFIPITERQSSASSAAFMTG